MIWRHQESRCAWGWRQAGTRAGLNDCSPSCSVSCGSGMQRRSMRSVRKQKTDRQDAQLILRLMLKDDFPQIWCRTGRIAICGNCCGIGIAWCKRGRGS